MLRSALFLAIAAVLVAGCGGSDTDGPKGRAIATIDSAKGPWRFALADTKPGDGPQVNFSAPDNGGGMTFAIVRSGGIVEGSANASEGLVAVFGLARRTVRAVRIGRERVPTRTIDGSPYRFFAVVRDPCTLPARVHVAALDARGRVLGRDPDEVTPRAGAPRCG